MEYTISDEENLKKKKGWFQRFFKPKHHEPSEEFFLPSGSPYFSVKRTHHPTEERPRQHILP